MITRNRNTKIVATIGPASSSTEMIENLFLAGVDVFRLNFSHGTAADHKERLAIIRDLEKKHNRCVSVIADMQGPKLRVGKFKDGSIDVKKGDVIRFDLDPTEGDETRVCLPHPEVLDALDKGAQILVDDGKVRITIIEKGDDYLVGKVMAGKKLSNNKGFNIPNVMLPISALTDKDRKDLTSALDMGVDWIAQSFVQKPADVAEAKKLIAGRAALMVKIEKPSAIEYFTEILDLADGVLLQWPMG